uniref:Uncharacterized protein n=1 Tax=Nymphaea colorata TaxID=210225 RepID=A0A5K1CDE8_9MAGN
MGMYTTICSINYVKQTLKSLISRLSVLDNISVYDLLYVDFAEDSRSLPMNQSYAPSTFVFILTNKYMSRLEIIAHLQKCMLRRSSSPKTRYRLI